MIKRICSFFSLDVELGKFEKALQEVEEKLAQSVKASADLAASLSIYESMYQSYMHKKSITEAIERCTPDMQWAKDLNGRYVYANDTVREDLLICGNPIDKTDMEIAGVRPCEHSDAGETCYGSDIDVLDAMKPMRFVEKFIVKGELLVLDVHKTPMYDDLGICIGTAGIGRDITLLYMLLEELGEELESNRPRRKSDDIIRQLQQLMEVYDG